LGNKYKSVELSKRDLKNFKFYKYQLYLGIDRIYINNLKKINKKYNI